MHDRRKPPAKTGRTFLVVVDDTEEMRAALRYAGRRARNTGGRLALLRVIEPPEAQHFAAIGNLMEAEARQAAEDLLARVSTQIVEMTGETPMLHVREGHPLRELLALMDEEPSISILVLASGTGPEGPGPLIQALTGRYVNQLHIPLTIVPGSLSDQAIDALS